MQSFISREISKYEENIDESIGQDRCDTYIHTYKLALKQQVESSSSPLTDKVETCQCCRCSSVFSADVAFPYQATTAQSRAI